MDTIKSIERTAKMEAQLAERPNLSPHKPLPKHQALLTPDDVSKIIGQPVWNVANFVPVKIGTRVYRCRTVDLELPVPAATDLTIPALARRWNVSDGVIRRMVQVKRLKLRSLRRRPAMVTAASIRKHERSRNRR